MVRGTSGAERASADIVDWDTTRRIWDTNYVRPGDAFAIFREVICNSFMPWSPERAGDEGFEGRVETIAYDMGVLGRVRTSPIVALKTKSNIAASSAECIHGNFVLSGELTVEQGGRTNLAKAGDLILYNSFELTKLTVRSSGGDFDNLVFVVPLNNILDKNNRDAFRNVLLIKGRMLGAIEDCLALLNESFYRANSDELCGIFEAIIALLPISVHQPNRSELTEIGHIGLQHEILDFVRCHVADQHLSPKLTAEKFGISVRYLHKLFTYAGTTFRSFVTNERLCRIQCELEASSTRHLPVSELAYRWGFSELSTFNRAFRAYSGCTPTEFRDRLSSAASG